MSRGIVLARGRAAAEAGMVDTCVIDRQGDPVTDANGDVTRPATTVYSGRCRVQQHQATADRKEIGEDHLLLLRLEVQLPVVESAGLQAGDLIRVTAAVNDPDLAGREFRIHDLAHKSEANSRRVQCIEKTGS